MPIVCIRGAITAAENTKTEILENTTLLLHEMLERNEISAKSIISVFFTATKDLDAAYPAVAARGLGITEAGLINMQEMHVEGSLQKCIRVLMHVEGSTQTGVKHVYLKGATVLRPDLNEVN